MTDGCRECGFNPDEWNDRDTVNTLRLAGQFIELWAEPLGSAGPEMVDSLPGAASWSVADPGSIDDASRDAVHELWHHLIHIAAVVSESAAGASPMVGSVQQLSASGGGVPKLAIPSAEIGRRGVVGDLQTTRKHHGRPWQALCLWSSDVITELNAEGHKLSAGVAGENITVSGIDWRKMHAGMVVEIGDMSCQLSAPADPCAKIRRWFSDNDSSHIDHCLHPGRARWYASVVAPGTIFAGDRVTVA